MTRPHFLVLQLALLVIGPASGLICARADDCPVGIIETVAGDGWFHEDEPGHDRGGGPPVMSEALSFHPAGIALGADGSLYVAGSSHCIRKVDPTGTITTVAGNGPKYQGGYSGDGGHATGAGLNDPQGVALGRDGSIYIADAQNHRIRRVGPAGIITTVAGDGWTGPPDQLGHGSGRFTGDGGPATQASLNWPAGVALGADGSIYIADMENHRIRKVDPAGIITTVAGTGERGYSGDGGLATQASLNRPRGVALHADGSLHIADRDNNRIRKVDTAGIITTVAGAGERGYSGDGGPAAQASLRRPAAVALGVDGSVYIADEGNQRIRKVDPAGIISTVAGDGTMGYSGDRNGDGGPATSAKLWEPRGVAIGPDGSLYIADSGNHRIRRVRWLPCEPGAAKAAAEQLRAKAADSLAACREVAELYLIAQAWDDALAAADHLLALTPNDEPARLRAQVLAARVYAAKRDDHEARRRLIGILARAGDPIVLRDTADVLVDLYLLRDERDQAIATLTDLRLRTKDRGLLNWIDRRLKEIAEQ